MNAAHALQDATKVSQGGGPGRFETPSWDPVSQKEVREPLLALNATLPDLRHAFGIRDQVDEVRHLIATAAAWGGNPDKDAIYLNVTPPRNDGRTVYKPFPPRFQLTPSGRSRSTTPPGISRKTRSTPMPSTTSPLRRTRMAP